VDTRLNSTLFLIKSIFEMKTALQSLKEGRFEDFDKTEGPSLARSVVWR